MTDSRPDAERDPRRTSTEQVRANTHQGTREVHRNIATGRFVKPAGRRDR